MVALPLVVRSLLPVLRAIDPRQREAAATLGAGPGRVRATVDLPYALRGGIYDAAPASAEDARSAAAPDVELVSAVRDLGVALELSEMLGRRVETGSGVGSAHRGFPQSAAQRASISAPVSSALAMRRPGATMKRPYSRGSRSSSLRATLPQTTASALRPTTTTSVNRTR